MRQLFDCGYYSRCDVYSSKYSITVYHDFMCLRQHAIVCQCLYCVSLVTNVDKSSSLLRRPVCSNFIYPHMGAGSSFELVRQIRRDWWQSRCAHKIFSTYFSAVVELQQLHTETASITYTSIIYLYSTKAFGTVLAPFHTRSFLYAL